MKKVLHTPEGVRDIYNVECGKKLALESRLKKTFHLYGYHDIQTPMFEYFDVFRKEIGTTASKDLYKFFDKACHYFCFCSRTSRSLLIPSRYGTRLPRLNSIKNSGSSSSRRKLFLPPFFARFQNFIISS